MEFSVISRKGGKALYIGFGYRLLRRRRMTGAKVFFLRPLVVGLCFQRRRQLGKLGRRAKLLEAFRRQSLWRHAGRHAAADEKADIADGRIYLVGKFMLGKLFLQLFHFFGAVVPAVAAAAVFYPYLHGELLQVPVL